MQDKQRHGYFSRSISTLPQFLSRPYCTTQFDTDVFHAVASLLHVSSCPLLDVTRPGISILSCARSSCCPMGAFIGRGHFLFAHTHTRHGIRVTGSGQAQETRNTNIVGGAKCLSWAHVTQTGKRTGRMMPVQYRGTVVVPTIIRIAKLDAENAPTCITLGMACSD